MTQIKAAFFDIDGTLLPFQAKALPESTVQALAALPLAPSWRRLVDARLARGAVEDWTSRMEGASVSPAAAP